MNLVLLSPAEAESGMLPAGDARTAHLLKIVGVKPGATFFIGIPDGFRGKATVLSIDDGIRFSTTWEKEVRTRLPLAFLVGLPRPQTAKKVLFELTTLGASEIRFFKSAKGDPAYATATLWRVGEWRDEVLRGAEQAFSTLLPEVTVHDSLDEALADSGKSLPVGYSLVAPDVYEATGPLSAASFAGKSGALIAIGPERGWSDRERDVLRKSGFEMVHLGDRVLRVETACVVAGGLALSALGCWRRQDGWGVRTAARL